MKRVVRHVPEFHFDLDGPLLEIFVFVDFYFAGALDSREVFREGVGDLTYELLKLWLPALANLRDFVVELGEFSFEGT